MSFKDFLKNQLINFFVISTMINILIFVLGKSFIGEGELGYEAFLIPLFYGALSLIPGFIMYSKRELSVREVVVRKVFQLLFLEIVIPFLVFGTDIGSFSPVFVFSFMLGVFVIYVFVNLVDWIISSKEADDLTNSLKSFQQENSEDMFLDEIDDDI